MKRISRLIIYAKDIQFITGKSQSTARRMLQRIRELLGKSKTDLITIAEFCACTGLDEEWVRSQLGN